VRHELLDKEQAQLFAELTCSLQIGLQSADPDVAGGVGRTFDREDFRRKVMLLNDSGATFGFDLIYGLPGDSLDRFREGLNFALSLYPNHLDIFPLSVLPGTALGNKAASIGLLHLAGPPTPCSSRPAFRPPTWRRPAVGAASDIFYSRGKAVAWFNGVGRGLKLQPVELLERFGDWLLARQGRQPDEVEFDDAAIWQLQREFLTQLFAERKLQKLLPAALDCVDYHYAYGVALMAVPPQPPDDDELLRLDPLKLPLRRASSLTLLPFHYEILDILESGEPDLIWIAKHLKQSGSWAAIYPAQGEVCTESLIRPYYRLLERLDGTQPSGQVAAKLRIPADDALELLQFALAEGMVMC